MPFEVHVVPHSTGRENEVRDTRKSIEEIYNKVALRGGQIVAGHTVEGRVSGVETLYLVADMPDTEQAANQQL